LSQRLTIKATIDDLICCGLITVIFGWLWTRTALAAVASTLIG
jgi:hypothetical protein